MFLPIGDDNPRERTPFVHYAILGVNVLVFLYTLALSPREKYDFFLQWAMVPEHFSVVTLFTSIYLHAGLAHLFGNMLFLWIVGDNVEDRLGHVGYFLFYHASGAAATLAFVALSQDPSIPLVGASGAISSVMGAYAVFFPNAKIRIWYWLFFLMDTVYVSAKWAVGLWFLEQLVLWKFSGGSGVAYEAHLGGLAFGVGAALVLRHFVLEPHDPAKRIVAMGEEPGEPAREFGEGSGGASEAVDEALASGKSDEAFRIFTRATGAADSEPLDEYALARLGAALFAAGSYGPAARVYDEMLRAWPEGEMSPEAAFRLGIIQSRIQQDYLRARDNLVYAHRAHPDPARRKQALDELRLIDSHLRAGLFRRKDE